MRVTEESERISWVWKQEQPISHRAVRSERMRRGCGSWGILGDSQNLSPFSFVVTGEQTVPLNPSFL